MRNKVVVKNSDRVHITYHKGAYIEVRSSEDVEIESGIFEEVVDRFPPALTVRESIPVAWGWLRDALDSENFFGYGLICICSCSVFIIVISILVAAGIIPL